MAGGGQLGHFIGSFANHTEATNSLSGQTEAYGLIYYNTTNSALYVLGASGGWAPMESPWAQDSGFIYLNTTTDDVVIGASSQDPDGQRFYIEDTSSLLTYTSAIKLKHNSAGNKAGWMGLNVESYYDGTGGGGDDYVIQSKAGLHPTAAANYSSVRCLTADCNVGANATLTTYYGLHIPGNTISGTLTTGYGIFLGDVGASTSWGLYQQSATDNNYLAGPVGLNTTTIDGAARLDIVDTDETASTWGARIRLDKDGAGTKSVFRGVEVQIDHGASEDAGTYIGYDSDINFVGGGTETLTTGYGLRSSMAVNTAGDIVQDYRGIYLAASGGSGEITTSHGIYIDTQDLNSTSSYGIYQVSSSDGNYFGGNFGLSTPPTTDTKIGMVDTDETAATYGIRILLDKDGAGKKTSWVGVESGVDHSGAAAGGNYYGFESDLDFIPGAAQTLDLGVGFRSLLSTGATDTVTQYMGLFVEEPTGTGTITTAFGVRIGDLGATTSYGIYQSGASMINFFQGVMALGTTTISGKKALIHVKDEENIGTGLSVNFQKSGTDQSEWTGISSGCTYTGAEGAGSLVAYTAPLQVNTAAGEAFTRLVGYRTEFEVGGNGETISEIIDFHAAYSEIDGTITSYYGLKVEDPSPLTTITNSYGVHIESMSGTTTSYGIYQDGTSDDNYFAGDIGLAVASPSAKIDILEENSPTHTYGLRERYNVSSGTGALYYGAYLSHVYNSGSTISTTQRGAYIYFESGNASTQVNNARGVSVHFIANAGSTISDFRCFEAGLGVGSTGTVTDAYGLYINDMGENTTTTTAYGIYIEDQTGTTNYALYSAGTADRSFFAGDLQVDGNIGIDTTPTAGTRVYIEEDALSGTTNGVYTSVAPGGVTTNKLHYGYRNYILQGTGGSITDYTSYKSDINITGNPTASSLKILDGVITLNGTSMSATTVTGIDVLLEASGGDATTMYGVRSEIQVEDASSSVSTAYAGYFDIDVTSGSLTTGYGVYIASITAASNNWGIYQLGASDSNYFAGPTGFGTSSIDACAVVEFSSTSKGVLLPRGTSDPASPVDGLIYYNTSTDKLRLRANGAWVSLN